MFSMGSFVRFRPLNCTGMVLYAIWNFNGNKDQYYLIHIKQGKGNEKAKQFFKTDFMCQCKEDDLEFVCLN
jgi:hypothetical protein